MSEPRWLTPEVRAGWTALQRRLGLLPDGLPGGLTLAAVRRTLDSFADFETEDDLTPVERHMPVGKRGPYSYGGPPLKAGLYRDPYDLLPGFAAKVETVFVSMRARGWQPILWEAYRTPQRAAQLDRDGAGIALSMHCIGAAVDVVDGDRQDGESYWDADPRFWEDLGAIAEELNLVWGGNWRRVDRPHIQAIPVHEQRRFRAMTAAERARRVA